MNALVATLVASTVLAVGQGQPPTPESTPEDFKVKLTVPGCLVSLLNEVEVPAEETGTLTLVPIVLGQTVVKGQLLAKTDDRTALLQKMIAEYRLNKAEEQAKNDVDYRYALKAAEVAETEHRMFLETNKKEPGTHAKITVQKAKLAWERADLQREQAEMNQLIAGMAADEARAEKSATELMLARCQTISPIDGIVTRIYKEEGEWVRPGEPLMRVIGMSHLKVEGSVDADVITPSELFNKPVRVDIELPNKVIETFYGYINFVSPEIDATGHYDISAKVKNRRADVVEVVNGVEVVRVGGGDWLLKKGEFTDMDILDPSKENIAKLND
ncbi:MAG: hypothetical protein COA78_23745 [Blastopirellula sp.]|nr:MAG: hypothetical protein COA78_23745 [Blastopirellula sp.]